MTFNPRRIGSATLLATIATATMAMTQQPTATPPSSPMPRASAPATPRTPVPADRTIADTIGSAPTLATLVTATKAAELSAMLAGPGPYTVFAPTDAAFARLAPGTVATLLKPENKAGLAKLLKYHMIAGSLSVAQIRQQIVAGGGAATLRTVEGDPLTVTLTQDVVTLTDRDGNRSYIEVPDIRQANGMVHIVNGIVVPKLD